MQNSAVVKIQVNVHTNEKNPDVENQTFIKHKTQEKASI